jgi:hypothetical protein
LLITARLTIMPNIEQKFGQIIRKVIENKVSLA